ncbi:Protein of unknown function [Blastococcus aggregatus]|uniref:DUF3068 domain-containing protein n=1 Tax=Blastococcus aggregatus TaxID=38502 RepID=A0A285V770_9ACTN|nr:porin PorA family protein [Blastococcus aggregatus]SOC49757.1 Protein of unknown function [Blastococcus aggregatus]
MRARIVGLTLIGLGALAVVAAVPARSWVPLVPVGLELDAAFRTGTLGEQVGFVDPVDLAPRTSDDVMAYVRIRGDADTGDAGDDVAVWELAATTNEVDGTLIGTSTTVACLDRRTAEAVDCVSASVDGERAEVRGLTVRFPIDTGRRDYDLWDATTRQAYPARFAGTESIRGLQVYRFEQEVPAQVVASVSVPGSLLGSPAAVDAPADVPADVVHGATRALLVDPVTGVVVSTQEVPNTWLRGPDGQPGAFLLSGTFTSSEESVDDALALVDDIRGQREVLRAAVPWVAGGTGGLLLLAGALVVVRSRPARTDSPEDEPAPVPVPTA